MDFNPIMYQKTDITEGVIVSGIFLILLALYFTYRSQNKYLMGFLLYLYRPQPAKLPKDTKKQDWILFIITLAVVMILGVKLVTMTVIISDSMRPEFQRGDIIFTQSIDTKAEIGDIITFTVKDQSINVSHRVIGFSGDLIKTKGDNNPNADDFGWITQKEVIAKAIQFDGHPIVIKQFGALFITDYSKTGIITRFGDKYDFMQQLSVTLRTFGSTVCILALLTLFVLIAGGRKK